MPCLRSDRDSWVQQMVELMKCTTCRGKGKVRGAIRAQVQDRTGRTIRTTTVMGMIDCTTCRGTGRIR